MKHKWIAQEDGSKKCEKCGSHINRKRGAFKTIERDTWGVMNAVSWYPRCNPLNKLATSQPKEYEKRN